MRKFFLIAVLLTALILWTPVSLVRQSKASNNQQSSESLTVNLALAANTDDAHERADNKFFASGYKRVRMGNSTVGGVHFVGGFRFNNVIIPKGAIIDSAVFNCYVDSVNWDDPAVDIFAENVDNPGDFVINSTVAGRTTTLASVEWLASNIGTGLHPSPDIKGVIQEIINRPGWNLGNALVILIKGKSDSQDFRCLAYDGSIVNSAKLEISYRQETAPITFSDVTRAAGINDANTKTWGVEWGDYDNDGYPDVFVSRHGGIPELYHNRGDGTFSNVTDLAGMAIQTDRHGCAWGDYNADKYLDFYCSAGAQSGTGSRPNQLFLNKTNGAFEEVAVALGVVDGPGRGRSVNWFDYDGDGHLDLYLGNFLRDGYPSLLFKGLSGSFVEVATPANVADNVDLRSSSWADFDKDGDSDLLIAAGDGVILHKNNGNGTFTTNSAAEANLISQKNLSGAWADYDNDDNLDLFLVQLGRPSKLYRNNGDGTFNDVTLTSGINSSKAELGQWGDFDNDGNLDLFVVNGYDFLAGQNLPDSLFFNNGNGTFTDMAKLVGVTGPTIGDGESAAWADYNRDGFLDLLVTNGGPGNPPTGPAVLYLNNGNGNHWLELRLVGNTNNTKAFGAKITLTAGGKSQFRQLTDNVVQYGQNDQIVHFGLGASQSIDNLKIEWPNGVITTLTNVTPDQILEITQP